MEVVGFFLRILLQFVGCCVVVIGRKDNQKCREMVVLDLLKKIKVLLRFKLERKKIQYFEFVGKMSIMVGFFLVMVYYLRMQKCFLGDKSNMN